MSNDTTPQRGAPRFQYRRTYVLFHPQANAEWPIAMINATHAFRLTMGGSADDAGIGDLDHRRVIAINPQEWQDDLQAFFDTHYPDVVYVPVTAGTPAEAAQKVRDIVAREP